MDHDFSSLDGFSSCQSKRAALGEIGRRWGPNTSLTGETISLHALPLALVLG